MSSVCWVVGVFALYFSQTETIIASMLDYRPRRKCWFDRSHIETNVGSMLGQRRGYWPNIEPTLGK